MALAGLPKTRNRTPSRAVPASGEPGIVSWPSSHTIEVLIDIDHSVRIDFQDVAALSQYWLQEEPDDNIILSLDGDSMIDFKDFAVLAKYRHVPLSGLEDGI